MSQSNRSSARSRHRSRSPFYLRVEDQGNIQPSPRERVSDRLTIPSPPPHLLSPSSGSKSPPKSFRSEGRRRVSALADLSPASHESNTNHLDADDADDAGLLFVPRVVSSPPLRGALSVPGQRPISARRIASSSLPGSHAPPAPGQPGEVTPGRAPPSQASAFRNKDFNVSSVQSVYPMRNPVVNLPRAKRTPRVTPARSPRRIPIRSPRRIDAQLEQDDGSDDMVMLSEESSDEDDNISRRPRNSLQSSVRFNDDPFDIHYTRMASGHALTSDSDADISCATPLITRDASRVVCVSRTHSETRDLRDISRIFEKTKSEKFADATPGVLFEMFLRKKRIIKKPHLFIVTVFFILYIMALSNRSADAELTAPVTKRFQNALFSPEDGLFGDIFGDDSLWNEQRQRWQNRPPTFIDPVTGLLTLTDAARQSELLERLCRGNFADKGQAGSRFGRHLYCELVELKWESDIDGCQYEDQGYIQNVTKGLQKTFRNPIFKFSNYFLTPK